MQSLYGAAVRLWDWRLSAHVRIASLSSVWLLVFCGSVAGPLLPVLGLCRMALGGAQLGLNHGLARNSPLAGRDRYDWLLLGLALAGSIAAASISRATGAWAPGPLLLVLLPYSCLQLRSFRRSLDAYRGPSSMPIPIPIRELVTERRAA